MIKIDREKWVLIYARIVEFKPNENNKKYLKPKKKNQYASLFQIAGIAIKGSLSSSYSRDFDSLEEAEQHMNFLKNNRYIDYKSLRSSRELFDSGVNSFNERSGSDWLVSHKMYYGCTDVGQVIGNNELYLVESHEELKDTILKYGAENISAIVNTIWPNENFIFTHQSSYYLQYCSMIDDEIRFSNGIDQDGLFNRKIFADRFQSSYYTHADSLLLIINPMPNEIYHSNRGQLELFA